MNILPNTSCDTWGLSPLLFLCIKYHYQVLYSTLQTCSFKFTDSIFLILFVLSTLFNWSQDFLVPCNVECTVRGHKILNHEINYILFFFMNHSMQPPLVPGFSFFRMLFEYSMKLKFPFSALCFNLDSGKVCCLFSLRAVLKVWLCGNKVSSVQNLPFQ